MIHCQLFEYIECPFCDECALMNKVNHQQFTLFNEFKMPSSSSGLVRVTANVRNVMCMVQGIRLVFAIQI